ncbi:MAG: tRNA (adenosine(37)-N6)-threonylcarbamoyltransferase complex dimerization subunit type 1 TsaB [bacterium]|nr:tRNA (adenosine(37)-N6)-threonylcarbamoyltransferase complex dimerization subunit type 1 TsaB [bacterium]
MLTLAINTASSDTAIALFEEDALIAQDSWKSGNDEAEKIMPKIKDLLGKRAFDEITEVFVIKGPGSFTGLRVGVAVANTIAYLNGAGLYAVSTFDYLRMLSDSAILVYAGSRGVYLSERGKEARMINMDVLNSELEALNIKEVHGDISNEQKSELKAKFTEYDKSFGEIMLDILIHHRAKPLTIEKIVKPLYIKAPSITQSKKICYT